MILHVIRINQNWIKIGKDDLQIVLLHDLLSFMNNIKCVKLLIDVF